MDVSPFSPFRQYLINKENNTVLLKMRVTEFFRIQQKKLFDSRSDVQDISNPPMTALEKSFYLRSGNVGRSNSLKS